MAETYVLMTDNGVLNDSNTFRRARAAAEASLALDPANANAYNALAFAAYRQDWDFPKAEEYFRKAISLDPNYAVAHQWYGEFLGDMRRFDQSIAELRKAAELDPLAPMVGSDLADGYLHAGRMDEAKSELKRLLDLYPDFPPAHLYRISVDTHTGDFAAALREAQVYLRLTHNSAPLQIVSIQRLAAAGERSLAREQLHRLLAGGDGRALNAFSTAQLYFLTGQSDLGYTYLAKAYKDHSWWLVTMLVDPGFEKVRAEPRFLSLAHQVGLAESSLPPDLAYSEPPAH